MTARYSDIDLNGFQGWLAEQGADILEPTNEYEKLRYRFGKSGIALVYWKPSKRIYSMVGPAAAHYRRWQAGESIGEPFIKTPTPTPSARPQIKVYTDASIYSQTQTGSWGAVLMMPDKSEHEFSGPLIGNVDSSTAAEMMAVTNAVHRGIALKHIARGSALMVICDNVAVIGYLKAPAKKRKSKSPLAMKALAHLADLIKRFDLRVTGHWVKGHQPLTSKCPHAPFNRRCDKLAKGHSKALHNQRQRIEQENADAGPVS